MSKQVDFFMKSVIEEEPKVKEEYLRKLDRIRKEPRIRIGTAKDFAKKFDLE